MSSAIVYGQQPYIFLDGQSSDCGSDCYEVSAFPQNFDNPPYSYLWSTGNTTQSFSFCQPGCYSITVTNELGNEIDTSFCIDSLMFIMPELLSDNLCPDTIFNDEQVPCEEVCVGTTINYTTNFSNIIMDSSFSLNIFEINGGYSPVPSVFSNGFQVTWDSTGEYNIFLNALFGNDIVSCYADLYHCVVVIAPPEAAISSQPAIENGVLDICAGQTAYFEYSGTNADSLVWMFGDGGSSNESDPSYTYEQAGTYQLNLLAFNNCTCQDTLTFEVVVADTETPIVDCVGTVCEGMLGTYTTSSTCNTLHWSVSDNGIVVDGGGTDDDFITVQWIGGDEGIIELLGEDCGAAVCAEPTIIKIPIVSEAVEISGPELVCRGERATYTIPAYEGTSIMWSSSNSAVIESGQGSNEIVVRWLESASFTTPGFVTVEIDNCYLGCSGTDTIFVDVRPEFFISGELEVCANSSENYTSINLGNNAPFNANWLLEDLNGNVVWQSASSSSFPEVDFPGTSGLYLLTARPVNPGDFCQEESTRAVYVLPNPAAVDAIEGNMVICPGEVQAYEAISSDEDVYFEWLVVNGSNSVTMQGNPINVTWGNTPPYEVSVVQVNALGEPCISSAVTLEAEAFANLAVTGPDDGCKDDLSIFTTTFAENIDYSWEITPPGAGTIISEPDESTVEIVWHQSGLANVSVTACTESASTSIIVHELPEPTVLHPDFLCPNETAIVQTTSVYTAYEWKDESDNTISTSSSPELAPGYYLARVTDEFGCVGQQTFHIQNFPESQISISTPDVWICCGADPDVHFYAENTEEGYQYQWYHDGNPVGMNLPEYEASEYGIYYVEVTDIFGCTYTSNSINVREDCGSTPGECGTEGGPSAGCEMFDFDFTITEGGECEQRIYENISTGFIPGSEQWTAFNQSGTPIGSSSDPLFNFEYSVPAFYRVRLNLDFPDPDNPGEIINCYYFKIDTILVVADFESTRVCEGSVTEFEDISTHLPFTSISSWQWDFDDPMSGANNSSADQHPDHTFTSAGIYDVQLTVADANGCTSTITRSVEVIGGPAVDFAEPEVSCANTASTFIADAPGSISFLWEFGDPASGDANEMGVEEGYHRFDNPGTYTVSLSVENIYGCENSISKNVDIAPNPLNGVIDAAPATTVCEGDLVTLTAPAGGISWEWSNGETTESISVGLEDVYALTITNADGCTYEPEAIEIEVIPTPENYIRGVEFSENGQPTAYYYNTYESCFGEPVYLEAFDEVGYSYMWSSGEQTAFAEYSEEKGNLLSVGSHDITLQLTDQSTGCVAIIGPFEVIIHPLPGQPQITANQPLPICEGGPVELTVSNPVAGFEYRWSNGAYGTTITVEKAGFYTVTAVNEFGCEQESEWFQILDGPPIQQIPSGCYTRCSPDMICLPDLPGVISYQWYFNGSPISAPEGNQAELSIDMEGSYYVELGYFNGCTLESDPLTLELVDGVGNITGQTYFDVNENGIIDGPDTLIDDITIQLWQNGTLEDVATSLQGGYGFLEIPSNLTYELILDTMSLASHLIPVWTEVDTLLEGCNQSVIVQWLVQPDCPESTTELFFEACEGESIEYNGNIIMAGSSDTFTYLSENGCDSTVTVNVGALEIFEQTIEMISCEGEAAYHDGQELAEGLNTFTYTTTAGCDSILNINLQVEMLTTNTLSFEACPDSTINFYGNVLSAGESATVVLTSQNGCDSTVIASVSAHSLPEANFSIEDACPDFPGLVNVEIVTPSQPPYQYAIDEGAYAPNAAISGLEGGAYTLYVQDGNGCVSSYELEVPQIEPLEVLLTQDSMTCEDPIARVSAELVSGDDGQLAYNWSDGNAGASRIFETPGSYTLELSNGCETISETINVPAPPVDEASLFYVPTAFSPNGDEINDLFEAYAASNVAVKRYELEVFDRYGGQVFYSDVPGQGWDGSLKGSRMNSGVYVWQLKTTVTACGQEFDLVLEGDMVLMR
jgi:gliding motility-associated-like protein